MSNKGLRFPDRTPAEELTYGLRLARWLKPGTTLASAAWSASPDTVVKIEAIDAVNGFALIKLSGGDVDTDYQLTCTFVASDGEKGQRDIRQRIIDVKPPQ